MARDDWARNETWSPAIETAFFERLSRAKNRQGYLRLQANMLLETRPDVALTLTSTFLEIGRSHIETARILEDRGRALQVLGRRDEAIRSYREAIGREVEFPGVRTHAYLRLALLVAEDPSLAAEDAPTLELLDRMQKRPFLPRERYWWHAARAMLLERANGEATPDAQAAIAFAGAGETGAQHRKEVGLVGPRDLVSWHDRLERLAKEG